MRFLKKFFSRFTLVGLAIILIVALLWAGLIVALYFSYHAIAARWPEAAPYISLIFTAVAWIISALAVLHVANRDLVPETKIPWIVCIVVLNVFGVFVYALFSTNRPSPKNRRFYRSVATATEKYEEREFSPEELRSRMGQWSQVSEALLAVNPSAVVTDGTKTEYLESGEAFMERLLDDLSRAQKYIFLEYFIIERGTFWNAVLSVLRSKIAEGVEVRVMYDDIGCMGKIHLNYHRTLKKMGVKCVKFTPFIPVLTGVHNNRDHRKIAVIDGKVGYTGGLNLADEYINAVQPFGHWKDVAVRLEGAGVRNLLLMFLRLYDMQTRKIDNVSDYLPAAAERFEGEGVVQPYGDGPFPLYARHLGEDVYINILNVSQKYVWITTPYLIIDYRMREALILAARRGVDVRIVTPHIPDKKIAFALTRSNYMALIKGGVKIYEYTPGFIHAKSFLADGEAAVVGTVNLDYRSFLFHYEDGVFMYRTKAVDSLKQDFERVFAFSQLQTEEDAKRSVVWRWICEIAKLFAPLF